MKKQKSASLKSALLIQSITPLFVLLFIKYFDIVSLHRIGKFFRELIINPITDIEVAFHSEGLLRCLIICISFVIIVIGVVIYVSFKKDQHSGFISKGETIQILDNISDVSVAFFVTYIIPLLMDDIDTPRGAFLFLAVLVMMLLMMRNTQLCYQNPILSMAGYKIFRFSFKETKDGELAKKECIGITLGDINTDKAIVRKQITDNVYMIYNKNGGE